MLPFGTRVTLNGHPGYVGVVLDIGASAAESYVVAWSHHKPDDLRSWYFRPELTVIESPDTVELRRLRFALTRLIRSFDEDDTRSMGTIDEYVQPIADAVIAWHKRQAPKAPRFALAANSLRLVKRSDARPDDWVWAAGFSGDDAFAVGPMQERDFARENLRYVVIGPDPATLTREPPPAPAEETVWGEP